MYYIERVNTENDVSQIMHYDRFGGTSRGVDSFKQAEGYESFEYVNSLVKMDNDREALKVQYGQIEEVPYVYNVIQKDDNAFRLDSEGNKVETPVEEPTT